VRDYGGTIELSLDTSTPAECSGVVIVESDGGSAEIKVSGLVEAGPILAVDLDEVRFGRLTVGDEPETTVRVTNSGQGELTWDYGYTGDFFRVDRANGCLVVRATGGPGRHLGSIWIRSSGGEQTLDVTAEIASDDEKEERKRRIRLLAGALVVAAAIAGGIVLVVAVTGTDPIFEDNFSTNEHGWDVRSPTGAGDYENGAYLISAERAEGGDCCVIASPGNETASSTNVRIEADGRPVGTTPDEGYGYGVFCRADESQMSFYAFTIWARTAAIGKVDRGSYSHLEHTPDIGATGQRDSMRLKAVCSTVEDEGAVDLQFFVDDKMILSTKDGDGSAYESGTFGLFTTLGGNAIGHQFDVEFDDFAVYME
jgi:hypothetical protein